MNKKQMLLTSASVLGAALIIASVAILFGGEVGAKASSIAGLCVPASMGFWVIGLGLKD